MSRYLLGIDLGSSSVKASLIEADSGLLTASATYPETEMEISSPHHGWAEQDPNRWWVNATHAIRSVLQTSGAKAEEVLALGIAYQMHGLVVVDKNQKVLRPSIIWCDSRAVSIGEDAYNQLGELYCMDRLLNSPGNFTASKLKWVLENEPHIYKEIHKVMLPGDYLAMRLTGEIRTTVSGLSEGIMWDYQKSTIPERLFNYYGLDAQHVSDTVPTFSEQGQLTTDAANELGLKPGTPVSYRAGDQPNNAFSLNALNPGEVAATAGTSGVIYGIVDKPTADKLSRVNTFVHVNHTSDNPRYGVLLCVNGTGIMNSWLRKLLSADAPVSYERLNTLAGEAPVGADNLFVLPFGNGAERVLQNINLGASIHGLDLNRHSASHISRAAQEGIVYALGYGFEVMNELGIQSKVIRAGHANMFLSELFCQTFVNTTGARLELYNTDGAQGAARGAGVGIGYYKSYDEAFRALSCKKSFEPDNQRSGVQHAFHQWKSILKKQINTHP
ncbi:MAG TPA: FGGY family carbohydrate kinase [Cyclobacteriaceae bacterium]|nr:FGGY family carbohydrate kinase [Cyclobacteriaceae bacterium]HRJ83200.1 FGGY family carbohydrate kinase [Cyclobacteriaceae bacterium]